MNEIEIYKDSENQTQFEVKFEEDTVWLSQAQLVSLFNSSKANISEHLKNIFQAGEVEAGATVRKFRTVRQEGKRTVNREVEHYNLDIIISIDYRVNTKKGTQFRQWATQRLKDYLVKGYAINEKRLQQTQDTLNGLKQTISLLGNLTTSQTLSGDEATALLKVLNDYSVSLEILDKYDHRQLDIQKSESREIFRINYKEAKKAIEELRKKFGGSSLFGNEKDKSFAGSKLFIKHLMAKICTRP